MTVDPYAHLPLMQRPDFVHYDHKHVLARRVQVGDIVLERQYGRREERWTITEVEVTDGAVWVRYQGWGRGRKTILGLPAERIWVARRAKRQKSKVVKETT